jgi:tetratricopeptide (TPR) repeat protein
MDLRFKVSGLALVFSLFLGTASLRAQSPPLPPGTSDTEQALPQTAAGPLTEAEAAIEAKSYDKARGLLDAYLSTHPEDARALFDRGYCEDAQGRSEPAKGYFRKATEADPKQFEARLALGLILAEQGSAEAREQLETATTLEPNPANPAVKAQAYRAVAKLLRDSDPDEAKKALLEALKLTPETVGDTLLTAEIAETEGDKDVAEQAYRRVVNVTPQGAESSAAVAGLSHLLIAEKKYSDAEPLLKSALTRDPDDPTLNTQYAALLSAEGKSDEAVAALEKLHKMEPQDREVAMMLADAYVDGKNYEKADAVYANLLTATPNDAELISARGQVLIREEKYPEAMEILQRAVKIKQDDSDAWGGIAFAASETHQFQMVIEALTMRSKLASETPATYFLWATAHDNLHHTKQAVEYYQLFLKSALGKFPDQEWQATQRLAVLEKK